MKIKTEVTMILRGTPERKIVWIGELSYVPREGGTIFLSDDLCGYDVHNVYMSLHTNSVYINILESEKEFYDNFEELKQSYIDNNWRFTEHIYLKK